MPDFEGSGGTVHYRSWLIDDPRATVVFLHGFGEHSGLYDRLAGALNARQINLWALDQIGHGLSDGERGVVGSIDNLVANGRELSLRAQADAEGTPVFLAGHSLGAITAAVAAARDPFIWSGAVLSGAAIDPPEWVAQALESDGEGLALEASDLSSDEWYLDALANDPLAFTESSGSPLDSLPPAWMELAERFGHIAVPVLFVHGAEDPIASIAGVRVWAGRLGQAELAEFAGAKHDVLNERAHEDVASAIADWVLERVPAATSVDRHAR